MTNGNGRFLEAEPVQVADQHILIAKIFIDDLLADEEKLERALCSDQSAVIISLLYVYLLNENTDLSHTTQSVLRLLTPALTEEHEKRERILPLLQRNKRIFWKEHTNT